MNYKDDFLQQTINLYKNSMKSIRDFKLSNNHEDITHQNIVSYATYSPWYDDKDFMAAYDACKKNTLENKVRQV